MNRRDHDILAEYQKRQGCPKRRAHEKDNPEHRAVVEAGGGAYVAGMMGELVLFNSPATGSTLALPENLLTKEAVECRIRESNAMFGVA